MNQNNYSPDRLTEKSVCDFLTTQKNRWLLYKTNMLTLGEAKQTSEKFLLDDSKWMINITLLNYRKKSATADIDKALKGERPCFLCSENRPQLQSSIRWEHYDILANPYPISDLHLTVADEAHRPQIIGDSIRDMARLTRILPDNAIFYNGPLCGASAPDHFHFQAISKYEMHNFIFHSSYLQDEIFIGKSVLKVAMRPIAPFPYFHIISSKDSELVPLYNRVIKALPAGDPEPMMNIFAWKEVKGGTSMVIVPRKAHRPQCYGSEGGRVLVSPASLELSGLFALIRKEDATHLNETTLQRIYDDVCISNREMEDILNRL